MTAERKADAPHVSAAFINEIAEGGAKSEAVHWLQITWNELCQAKRELSLAQLRLAEVERELAQWKARAKGF